MYSLSIDYLFNRIYDILLWFKYVWLFVILRTDTQSYIDVHKGNTWDGLRDRGWFDTYLASKNAEVPPSEVHLSLWQKIMENFGFKLPDSDLDGIPDVSDSSPYDSHNLSPAQLKERYQEDYDFFDHARDAFGISPKDSDGDGVPDSYEVAHGIDSKNPDSDRDGVSDGQEIIQGTDTLNNDSDHDGVIDGRDGAPLDGALSSSSIDADGDGVSDKVENIIGTDIYKKDSDGDGILDSMDTYPLDSDNVGQIISFDVSKSTDGLHFSIQNPILALFADFLSIVAIVIIVILVYASMRWIIIFFKSLNDYENHFEYDNKKRNDIHVIKHDDSTLNDIFMPAGIENLPVNEEVPTTPPTAHDFKDHPRFAIIQGYMSSKSEALWRIGIMEADNMLQEVLREKGYQGVEVGEMLKEASFKTIDLAWDAHKLRNRIAHEGSDFVLTEREAKRAFTLYESVFRELKAIH